jgi:gliding motility-associated-like protein
VVIAPNDTVCYRDSVSFTAIVPGTITDTIYYQWQMNFVNIPGAIDSLYIIRNVNSNSPGFYRCIITVGGINDTSDNVLLWMRPRMKFDTLFRYNELGCPTVNKTIQTGNPKHDTVITVPNCQGQFKALVSGGTQFKNYPQYLYDWHAGHSQDTIVFGLCPGSGKLTVTDSLGCSIDSVYFVDVLKLPKVDFKFSPKDTIYLTNPTITVAFPDSMRKHLTNWTWDFGDKSKVQNLNPATHIYGDTTKPREIPVSLKFTDENGCDTVIIHTLTLKIAELNIGNLMTPNADGANDMFAIELKETADPKTDDFRQAYLSNEFMVFDRWGKKVYDKNDYKSKDWDGGNLSDGTYFYILKCKGQYGEDVFRGSVTILRGK